MIKNIFNWIRNKIIIFKIDQAYKKIWKVPEPLNGEMLYQYIYESEPINA